MCLFLKYFSTQLRCQVTIDVPLKKIRLKVARLSTFEKSQLEMLKKKVWEYLNKFQMQFTSLAGNTRITVFKRQNRKKRNTGKLFLAILCHSFQNHTRFYRPGKTQVSLVNFPVWRPLFSPEIHCIVVLS